MAALTFTILTWLFKARYALHLPSSKRPIYHRQNDVYRMVWEHVTCHYLSSINEPLQWITPKVGLMGSYVNGNLVPSQHDISEHHSQIVFCTCCFHVYRTFWLYKILCPFTNSLLQRNPTILLIVADWDVEVSLRREHSWCDMGEGCTCCFLPLGLRTVSTGLLLVDTTSSLGLKSLLKSITSWTFSSLTVGATSLLLLPPIPSNSSHF